MSESVSQSVSESVGQSVGWSVGRSVGRSVGQSVSQSSQLVQMLPITENTILFVLLLRSSGCLQQKPVSIQSFEGPEDFAATTF